MELCKEHITEREWDLIESIRNYKNQYTIRRLNLNGLPGSCLKTCYMTMKTNKYLSYMNTAVISKQDTVKHQLSDIIMDVSWAKISMKYYRYLAAYSPQLIINHYLLDGFHHFFDRSGVTFPTHAFGSRFDIFGRYGLFDDVVHGFGHG